MLHASRQALPLAYLPCSDMAAPLFVSAAQPDTTGFPGHNQAYVCVLGQTGMPRHLCNDHSGEKQDSEFPYTTPGASPAALSARVRVASFRSDFACTSGERQIIVGDTLSTRLQQQALRGLKA